MSATPPGSGQTPHSSAGVPNLEAERLKVWQTQARLEAEAASARAALLLRLTTELSQVLTVEQVAAMVLSDLTTVVGAQEALLALLVPPDAALKLVAGHSFPETTISALLTDATRRNALVVVESPAQLAERYPDLTHSPSVSSSQAWVAIPLHLERTPIGALGLVFSAPTTLGDAERTFLLTVAALCAQALERVRLALAAYQAQTSANETLALLELVIEVVPLGFAVMDLEFRYQRANPFLARLNGRPALEHIGRPAHEMYPRAAEHWEQHWNQVLATGQPIIDRELSAPSASGELRHMLVSYYPLRVGEGPMLGVSILVVDVTALKQAEAESHGLLAREQAARHEAELAQATAEAALQVRDSFLAVASHELKTPLTSLLGQAQLLARRLANENLLTDPNRRSLQMIIGQTRRLSLLIDDLFDGAHLQSGQLTLELRPLDLGATVRRVVDDLQPLLLGRTLICTLDPGPLPIHGDLIRLEQVIHNLLSNAVKYSPANSTVRLTVWRQRQRVLIAVQDEGIGIPPEDLAHVFERFYRVEWPDSCGISGVGVGLFIVRELVRLHGGSVEVASTLGVGSTFTVVLPLVE